MGIAQVGNWTSAQFNNNTGGSLAGRTSTAGNHVVIGYSTSDAASLSVTHSQAGTVQTARAHEANGADFYSTRYVENIVGGASHTITVTTAANQFTALHATEYSGILTSSSLDKTANGTGTDTTNTFDLTSGATAAVSQRDELVVGPGGIATNSAGGTWSGQGGYALRGNTTAGNIGSVSCLVDQIISAGGTPTTQARLTDAGGLGGGTGQWLIQTVTFKSAAVPTIVQAVRGQLNNGTSQSVTLASTSAGNTIVVALGVFANTVAAGQVTDNKGGGSSTYSLATEQHVNTAAITGIVYAANIAAGITQVTYNPGAGAGQFGTFVVYELAGVASAPFDKPASGSGNGTAVASGSTGALTQANECAIAVCATDFGGGGSQAVTETAPWVLDFEDETSAITQNSETHQNVAATTALNAQWTLGAIQNWGASLATFKAASTTVAETGFDPRRLKPPGRRSPANFRQPLPTAQAGAAQSLVGQSDGVSTTTASMVVAEALTATSAATSTTTGALIIAKALAGQSDGVASTTATMKVAVAFTGQSDGVSSDTATEVTAIALAATSAAVSTTSGAEISAVALAASSAGVSSTTAAEITAVALNASSDGVSTATGTLSTGNQVDLAGQSDATSSTTAVVRVAAALNATTAGVSSTTATLSSTGSSVPFGHQLGSPEFYGVGGSGKSWNDKSYQFWTDFVP